MLLSFLSTTLTKTAMTSFFQTNKLRLVLAIIVLGTIALVGYNIHVYILKAEENTQQLNVLTEKYKRVTEESNSKSAKYEELQKSIQRLDEILVDLRKTNELLQKTWTDIKSNESKNVSAIKQQAINEAKKNNPQAVASGDVYGGTAAHVASTDQKISRVRIETITKLYCSMEVESARDDLTCPKN